MSSSLTFIHIIFGIPKTPKFGQGAGGAFSISKYWNIDKRLIYFKRMNYRDNWHNSRDRHNLDFSDIYGAHPALVMFELDSQQAFLCLLCYVLLVYQSYFNLSFNYLNTAWKVSKHGVISHPYFPAFGLNTESYSVNLRIQSE